MTGNRRFDPTVNYYSILNVSKDASREEIVRTYRALMRDAHPDNFTDPGDRARAEEHSKRINAAYAVLSRPEVRREYDSMARRSAMADTVKQRYTSPSPAQAQIRRERPPRPSPSQHTIRTQQSAYNGAVWQLVITFTGVTIGLIMLIVLASIALEGLQLLFT